jgi:hypothetical protein
VSRHRDTRALAGVCRGPEHLFLKRRHSIALMGRFDDTGLYLKSIHVLSTLPAPVSVASPSKSRMDLHSQKVSVSAKTFHFRRGVLLTKGIVNGFVGE